jgi:hypothetical protein
MEGFEGLEPEEFKTVKLGELKGENWRFVSRRLGVKFIQQERVLKHSPAKNHPSTKTLGLVLAALKEKAGLTGEYKRDRLGRDGEVEISFMVRYGKVTPAMLATAQLVFEDGGQYAPEDWVAKNKVMLRKNYKIYTALQTALFENIQEELGIASGQVIEKYGREKFLEVFFNQIKTIALVAAKDIPQLKAAPKALPSLIIDIVPH